jgi:hypothetical protein
MKIFKMMRRTELSMRQKMRKLRIAKYVSDIRKMIDFKLIICNRNGLRKRLKDLQLMVEMKMKLIHLKAQTSCLQRER